MAFSNSGESVDKEVISEVEKFEETKLPPKPTPMEETTLESIVKDNDEDDDGDGQREENFTQEQMDEFDQKFEEIEVSWLEDSKKLFTVDLGLSEDEYEEYLTMRKGFEEDRFEAYQKYHKENLEKKGDYPITNEDDANERILSEYQELFKARFGEEALAKYLKSLDGFNSRMKKSEGQDGNTLTIDF